MRRFESHSERSAKFWEVQVDGVQVITRWSRVGTTGQSKSKEQKSAEAAEAEAERQIAAKLRKGYAEVGEGPVRFRRDVFVENEGNAIAVANDSVLGIGREAGSALPAQGPDRLWLPVAGDGPVIVRVILGEAFSPKEDAAWIGELTGHVDLRGGRLVLGGGDAPFWPEPRPVLSAVRQLGVPAEIYRTEARALFPGSAGWQGLADLRGHAEADALLVRRWLRNHPNLCPPVLFAEAVDEIYQRDQEQLEAIDEEDLRFVDYLLRLAPVASLPHAAPVPAWSFRDPGDEAPVAIRARAVDTPPME
jgi:predicted DNA-binding WGR domain protein